MPYFIHDVDGGGVGPVAVVDGDEHDAGSFAVERCQHHVTGVQRMYEVRREGVLLFHHIWLPAQTTHHT